MKITILGCGTSTGVPFIQCPCKTCRSPDPKNKRLRASLWIQEQGKSFLIDTATDLRQQALRAHIPRVDAVLYTHPHADHLNGVDELRSFNFLQKTPIPVYGHEWTCTELKRRFPYIFAPDPAYQKIGGGIPLLLLELIDQNKQVLSIEGVEFQVLWVKHGAQDCLGYRIGSAAYVTDCHFIPPETLAKMRGLSALILDCVRIAPHNTHLNLEGALKIVEELRPEKTYLTHLSHDFEYHEWVKRLPKDITLAYDGLEIDL